MIKWTAVERGKFTRYYEVHQRDVSKNGCPRLTVICRLSDMATPEAKAIANLIAAAPAMLEALKGVVRVADRATVEFDAARAAVESAEGLNHENLPDL